jgi:DNA modification methylase
LRDYGAAEQLGLEPTPDAYVASMVAVFREVWRVLRDDGTLWLNIGDSYAMRGGKVPQTKNLSCKPPEMRQRIKNAGLKPKDLVGIPWMLAFALRSDGWYLRSEIIWHKPNPMPEGVTDRPTKAHEQIFLLAKSERYWYDADAICEKSIRAGSIPGGQKYIGNGMRFNANGKNASSPVAETRNARSVWTISTRPFPGAHFATFPPEIPERCIKAGCPVGGIVFDPFNGAGTTGVVATGLGRDYVGLDINPDYLAMAARRIARPHARIKADRGEEIFPLFA